MSCSVQLSMKNLITSRPGDEGDASSINYHFIYIYEGPSYIYFCGFYIKEWYKSIYNIIVRKIQLL